MPNFVHLHCHTEFSLLDGAIRLHDLCTRARDFGMPAAAITDHGVLYGAATFYNYCREAGIKPILGCEVYVAKDHTDKTSSFSKVRHHLILLAQNNEGYHNLVKLVTHGCLEGYHYRPRVDKDLLRRYSDGIIALSACIAGEIPRTLLGRNRLLESGGTEEDALRIAKEYADIYPDRFYLEVQANSLPEQAELNRRLIALARKTGLPLVATNDCHYLDADDVEAHDVLLCIQTQAKVTDTDRLRFEARDLYYKSTEEMVQAFSDLPEAIKNTIEIADACNVELDLSHHFFPVYPLPEGMTLETEFLKLAREGLKRRLDAHPDKANIDQSKYWERLEKELHVILDMGFPGYFLIVQNFINWAKDHGIPVGPGRGSAAGSLVAWALRITNLDPLPYNLLFERFLNNERVSLPDIDVDFCEDRRGEVIQYMINTYGSDSVAQIATFGRMKAKAVIRDVGRAMDMTFKETDRIAKLIPEDLKMTIKKALELEPELAALYKEDLQIRKVIDISMRLEGLARHASTHAAGIVVSDKPMEEYLPLYKGKKGELVTQYDMKMVEKVGLVKFDFLGLRTMTLISNTIKAIAEQGKTPPDLDTLPQDDPGTYELFSKGDTDGVFQLESSGMRQYLRQLKPSCFEDIIAMLALYRPGPLGSGMVDEFIKRKHGEVPVDYLLPSLENCLKDTYGVIVYQEQVMQIAQIVAGYTLGGADLLRRAMGKKNAAAMAEQRTRFVTGAVERGVKESKAGEIFDLMEKFAEYGFNKSHSAAYALVTYHTAYLKLHHKVEFMSALLTSEIGNQDKLLKYIAVCRDMGIEVRKPDVCLSKRQFIVREGCIIYGLGGIKNVGDEAIREIVEAREKDGPFTSLFDLCTRVNLRKVTKRVLESLIKSGACDVFGATRISMFSALDAVVARAQRKNKEQQSNQNSLLSFVPQTEQKKTAGIGFSCEEEQIPEWSEEDLLRFEKESLGFFLTSHPLQPYHPEMRRLGLRQLEEARELPDKTQIRVGVLVTGIKEILNKRGNRMAFVTVEDLTATAEVTFFTEDFLSSRELLKSDQPLLLTAVIDNKEARDTGDTPDEDGDTPPPVEIKLRGISTALLSEACRDHEAPVTLHISQERLLQPDAVPSLKALLERHRGTAETLVELSTPKTRCLLRLGPRWCVTPTPKLYQDLKEWQEEKAS